MSPTNPEPTLYSKAAFYTICSLIVFAPLARGSVHAWAVSIIQMGVCLAALFLILESFSGKRNRLPATSMHRPILAAALLSLISFIFSDYTPFAFEGIVMLFVYITAFYATLSSIRTRKEQRLLVYMVVFTGILISVIGILKRLGIPTLPWWLYQDVGLAQGVDSVSGPYVNRNHMAGFLEMTIPFALVLISTRTRSWEGKATLIIVSLLLLITQAFTLSRGGWISTLAVLFFMAAALLYQRKTIRRKSIAIIGTATMVIALFMLSSLPVVERLTTLTQENYEDTISGRLRCWKGVGNQIKDNLIFGTGPNTFAEAYPAWQIPGKAVLRQYAHNDYLHFISEIGIFLIPVIVLTLYVFFKNGFMGFSSRSRQKRGFALAGMAGVFAILLHSISDFNLNIPANAFLFIVISGMVFQKA